MALTIGQMLSGNSNQWNIDTYLNTNMERYKDVPEIANQFKALAWFKNSTMEDVRQNIINAYNLFETSTNPAFRNYIETSLSSGKKILSDIEKQRQFAEQYYWPGGEAEKMINEYVTKYGDSLAAKSAQAQSLAKNIWIRSGASASAVRAWMAQQEALDIDNLIKFQENKVNSLTNLYNQYNQLISWLRAEASTANQAYILQPLSTILERQSQIASALVKNEAQLNSLRLSSWGSSSSGTWMLDLLNAYASLLNQNWGSNTNKQTWQEAIDAAKNAKTWADASATLPSYLWFSS